MEWGSSCWTGQLLLLLDLSQMSLALFVPKLVFWMRMGKWWTIVEPGVWVSERLTIATIHNYFKTSS